VSPYARGKGPGGSGAINFMMWVRGARQDFDTWARLGAEGWSYEECLPFFRRAEDVREAVQDGLVADGRQRGVDGVTKVSLPTAYKTDAVVDGWLDAMRMKGFAIGDYNDLRHSGDWAGRMQYSIHKGARSSPEQILRRRLEHRSAGGLTFATGGHAAGVVLAADGRSARGVRLLDASTGESVEVFARRETILSGGVVGSAQLLMLSGIGPRDHLESLGIGCRTNLPVGESWSDHLYMHYRVAGGALLEESGVYGDPPSDASAEYAQQRSGPLSKVFGDVCAFSTPVGARVDGGPDLQLIPFPCLLRDDDWSKAQDGKPGPHGVVADSAAPAMTLFASVAQPRSRGRLLLRSADPTAAPIIDQRFYDELSDMELHVAAFRQAEELLSTGPFRDTKPMRPDVNTDGDVREYLRSHTMHGWHGCGTCRMGQRDDPAAVVDPSLRLRGVDGLRVCDASTFPVVPSGNTNAPTVMLAEKGADLIKRDHAELFA